MESPNLLVLRQTLLGEKPLGLGIRDVLARLDHLVTDLSRDLQVELAGPAVGMRHTPDLHRLCVARHHWTGHDHEWGVAICSMANPAFPRCEWRLSTVSRERLPIIVRALPAFFREYARIALELRGSRPSVWRLHEIAELLCIDSSAKASN